MVGLATIMALMRGLHLAATLSLLGTAGFLAWMLPAAGGAPYRLRRRLIHLWWSSRVVALAAGLAWVTLQAAAIVGADDASQLWTALRVVAAHTRCGMMLTVRLALVLAATAAGLAVSLAIQPGDGAGGRRFRAGGPYQPDGDRRGDPAGGGCPGATPFPSYHADRPVGRGRLARAIVWPAVRPGLPDQLPGLPDQLPGLTGQLPGLASRLLRCLHRPRPGAVHAKLR